MHQNSALLFRKYAASFFKPGMHILEIGPDKFPSSYCEIVNDASIKWDTLDIHDNSELTYVSLDEYRFPLPSGTYDIILSGNVAEHVCKIWLWIQEVSRVCKDNGLVITITPVSWPYHEAPVDCWRIYPDGISALYEDAGLKVITSVFESLEVPQFSSYIPGRSPEWQAWKNHRGNHNQLYVKLLSRFGFKWKQQRELKWKVRANLLNLLGVPVERAYDTIAIGRKTGGVT